MSSPTTVPPSHPQVPLAIAQNFVNQEALAEKLASILGPNSHPAHALNELKKFRKANATASSGLCLTNKQWVIFKD